MRRRKLCCYYYFLIFLAIFLFYKVFYNSEQEDISYDDDFDATENEKFVKKYLELMQQNRAPVRPVIEKQSQMFENRWCFLSWPQFLKEPRKWIKMAGIEMFSAYYDDRSNSLFPQNSAIQVLIMSNHSVEGKIDFYCNLFVNQKYAVVRGYVREIWQRGWDPRDTFQVPSLITCPIPKHLDYPYSQYSISLTRSKCRNQKIALKVDPKPKLSTGKKQDVVVCVKGLDYQEEISAKLLEWIELQYILGADMIGVYMYYLTEKTRNVLKYYEKMGKLKLNQISLSGTDPNDDKERSKFLKQNRAQKRRHELIPYNDCFYRHIHTHNYVLILDIDEVVVPVNYENYSQLLRGVEKRLAGRNISSLSARNVFKFQTNFTISQDYRYMLNNKKRSKKTSKMGEFGKSFSSTRSVATVFNHFALHKLSSNSSKSVYLSPSEAIKLHYKSECPWESRNECHDLENNLIDDTSLEPFEARLTNRVNQMRSLLL